ncbi:cell division protein FtsB [Haloactinospora alba]|uniref:Cell division protein FtsB n=1 Tax=Haloactinospora alba TaxID=405555 RepID=A0A543NM94_9ACTN|nr:septum formation initiator family protein [Haloactinospora alba]TQN32927.1 cell division protein FtsB [Haloactinospora alba]
MPEDSPQPKRSRGSRPGGAGPRPARGQGRGGRAGAGRLLPSRPALTSRAAILALVVCAIALSLAYPLREYIAQRSEIAQLRAEREETREKVEELRERRERLQDPDYIEREARSRLHYQYPGEHSYVIVSGTEGDEDGEDAEEKSQPWFSRLWESVREADEPGPDAEEIPEAQPPER